jgi:hypothetical protein
VTDDSAQTGPADDSRVAWREWGPEPFADAAASGRPVLVFLTATWCDDCHEMLATTFAEPRIAANVSDGFVPVKVDVDRHPRVRERYNMGGFPSTVFCTPDGELLTGATYLAPAGFRDILDQVRQSWDARGADAGRVPRALAGNPTPDGELDESIPRHFAGQLDEQWDEEFAGWGTDAKFPLPDTVTFALKRDRRRATQTLDAIQTSLQGVDGGFDRYAAGIDNAALVRAFAHGYLYTGEASYRTAATDAVGFLRGRLRVGDAFGGSIGPSGQRRDLTVYADGNALLAEALATLAAYTDDEDAERDARGVLAHLRTELIDDDGQVRHFADDDAPADLLADGAHVVRAFTTAAQVFGEGVETARTVADRLLAELGDADGFRDGPAAGVGLLDRPLRPIDDTVTLTEGLLDLAALTGDDRYRERAQRALAAFAGATDRMGAQVAAYGGAVDRLLNEPPVVAVGTEPGSDLHRAAAVVRGDDGDPATEPETLVERVADATSRAAGTRS